MKPRWAGKLATVMQFAFLAAVLLDASAWRQPLLWATAIISGIAGVDSVMAYVRQRREGARAT